VVGFELKGRLREGVTATDLVLTVTEILRREKVVGKFVEFFGEGAETLAVPDRATIANMAPEYGATMGFFPVDAKTVEYFKGTGRTPEEIAAFEAYFKAQGLFGVPKSGEIAYSQVVTLDLATVAPSLAGPKRPQDRIELGQVKRTFARLFSNPVTAPGAESGFNQPAAKLAQTFATSNGIEIRNGDVLIAAITSCTNTSNPGVLLAAGLLAKKAVERGLTVSKHIKTSLAPGSRIVTEYLTKTGLLPCLEQLGFAVAAYGCTTCIGNAGDLAPELNEVITRNDLVCAAVLSGNRNFEARIHPNLKANFLASPPLVVAYALAGTVLKDLTTEPLGQGTDGKEVWLRDLWPSSDEIYALLKHALDPQAFAANYSKVKSDPGDLWRQIQSVTGQVYAWPKSTYIAEPPFFQDFALTPGAPPVVRDARVLGIFGDSITTDHISPAGSIQETSPAGQWLIANGVTKADFNSYGARRGHHEVMMRGTFANVRIKNLMIPPNPNGSRVEGGLTIHQPSGERMAIYDAAMRYLREGVPTVVFGGEEYGTGSSRDWAAKGTQLLGVKAVIARSFERIHRSNLVGMGVLPLQFISQESTASLGIQGDETFDLEGLEGGIRPQQDATLVIKRADGSSQRVKLRLRIDTPIEVDYYRHGGILPFVLRQLLAA
jgi:aconitate hydratase